MNKTIALILAGLLCFALVGCGRRGSPGSAVPPKDYAAIIQAARLTQENEVMPIATPGNNETDIVDFFGVQPGDMQDYAISASLIIVRAYGVAIILPAEGRTQQVLDGVNAYVEAQRQAQQNYLPDQYEIASNAIVRQAPSGEVLLAMAEGAPEIMENIEAALAA